MKLKIILFTLLIIGIFAGSFYFANNLIDFTQQRTNLNLVAHSPGEGISTYLKVSFILGSLISLPFFLFLLLSYIKPALYDKERKILVQITHIIKLSIGLFMVGVAFGIVVIFDYILPYMSNFNEGLGYQLLYTADTALMFIIMSIIYSGIVFQTPIINYHLLKYKIIKIESIKTIRVLVILGAVIIGAVITPPDALSQVIFSLPIWLLFEISTIIWRLKQ